MDGVNLAPPHVRYTKGIHGSLGGARFPAYSTGTNPTSIIEQKCTLLVKVAPTQLVSRQRVAIRVQEFRRVASGALKPNTSC